MESPGKKFTDLVEIESIQDTDLAVVRNDTGVKKTPMQKLSDYIKQKFIGWVFSDLPTTDKTIPGALKELNSALAEETKQFTYKGLSISAIKKSGILRIKITGSANAAFGTNNNYVTIATLPAGFTPQGGSFKFINFYTEKNCQLQILSNGSIQLGYSRNNGSPEDITSGDGVRIDESFVI